MDVQFTCLEGADLSLLLKAYPDLYHDDTDDGCESYWIGKSSEEYYDSDRHGYEYGTDEESDFSETRDDSKEDFTWAEAAEFCGFAETLIPGSSTMLEGNGPWAQGELRSSEEYQAGIKWALELAGLAKN